MTVANIIDRRTNSYDIHCYAVAEPSWHDNHVSGATQFPKVPDGLNLEDSHMLCYDDMRNTTVANAIKRWNELPGPYTVFLYDVGTEKRGYRWIPETDSWEEVEIER